MTTLKEIAKKANVSIATVSYALNDSDQVSQKTKYRILKIVDEMKYKPNMSAKSLRTNKTMTIGIIAEDISVFNTPEIINGIGEYAEENGYNVILNNLRLCKRIGNNFSQTIKYKKTISNIIEQTLSRELDGVVYIGSHFRDVTEIIKDIDKPIVCTYCYADDRFHYSVNFNEEAAAYDATQHLIKLGHHKVAVITGLVDSIPCQARLKGYQRAIMDSNSIINPLYVKVGNWEYESGYQLAKELLSSDIPPTAIFAMNDLMAGGVIDAARELNINIPQDLSVIGFDNRDCSFYFVPKLSTIEIPLNEMGKEAAKLLINQLSGNEYNQRHLKIDCKFIERQSVKNVSI